MGEFGQGLETQPTPAESNSHSLGDIWHRVSSKVSSTAQDGLHGAQRIGQKVVDATPGVIHDGTEKAKALATPHNIDIAKKAGEAGAKAAVFGPHAAVAAAGFSVYEQATGHKAPINPMNIKGEIAKRVIDGATGSDASPVSHLPKHAEKVIANPFGPDDAPTGGVVKKVGIPGSVFLKGIQDTASKYLPHSTIASESETTQMKR
jgi:hypothetical protein